MKKDNRTEEKAGRKNPVGIFRKIMNIKKEVLLWVQ